MLALEDPGIMVDIVWVDTSSRRWQQAYHQRMDALENKKTRIFKQSSVDRIDIYTNEEYTLADGFFQERAMRIKALKKMENVMDKNEQIFPSSYNNPVVCYCWYDSSTGANHSNHLHAGPQGHGRRPG